MGEEGGVKWRVCSALRISTSTSCVILPVYAMRYDCQCDMFPTGVPESFEGGIWILRNCTRLVHPMRNNMCSCVSARTFAAFDCGQADLYGKPMQLRLIPSISICIRGRSIELRLLHCIALERLS